MSVLALGKGRTIAPGLKRASQAIGSAEIPDIKKAWIFCLLAVIGFRYHAVKDSFPAVYQKACRDMGIDPSDGQKLADKKKKR